MEGQITKLKTAAEQEKAIAKSDGIENWRRESYISRNVSRPASRASTAFAGPTTPKLNGKMMPPTPSIGATSPRQKSSTWDSMHAPSNFSNTVLMTPKSRRPPDYRMAAASPTPSVVSLAPTQGDDGWWS